MSRIIFSALAASLLITSTAHAGPWNRDRIEDRADRYEDRIDARFTYGPRDRIEDRFDRAENRFDERNPGRKCKASEVNCRGEASAWWQDNKPFNTAE